jgi:hypothetical protein
MPTNEELVELMTRSIEVARQMGYKEGELATQNRVLKAMKDYSDIADTHLLTAVDAFRIVLHNLLPEGDNNG